MIIVKTNIAPLGLKLKASRFSVWALKRLSRKRALSFLGKKKEVSFSLLLVSEKESAGFNRRFRKKDYAANVLSFPMHINLRELKGTKEKNLELGDIVIPPAVVSKEAKSEGRTFYAQFCLMLAHGILHILGFDHERTPRERKQMEKLESDLLLNCM